jgi:quercetin dioxygenase-like cupin family protein
MKFGVKIACIAVVAGLAGVGLAFAAEDGGIKRTLLQREDVNDKQEAIMGISEIAKGVAAGRHTHFGTETSYILDGEIELRIDGESPRKLHAGEAFQIPAGKIHDATSIGTGAAKIIAVYVVEKGKPLATPAK